MNYEEFLRVTLPPLGYNWHRFRHRGMRRRLALALRECGAESWDALSRRRGDPEIQRLLRKALTVTISRFWRNGAVFRIIGQVALPEITRYLGPGEPLIAWSAGTASGQEAFSLAMAITGLSGEVVGQRPIHIVGSDIDERALRRGQGDAWTEGELKELPPELRSGFFGEPNAEAVLDPLVRQRVRLIRASLWDGPPLRRAHLILCRNSIMTYFHGAPREEAFARLIGVLAHGGWLVLGRKEVVPKRWAAHWGLLHLGHRMYRRRMDGERGPACLASKAPG